MNIFLFLMTIFSQFNLSSGDVPARLDKKTKSTFQEYCDRACPYVIISCLIILSVLLFIALARYGHAITGTEANQYYYHLEV